MTKVLSGALVWHPSLCHRSCESVYKDSNRSVCFSEVATDTHLKINYSTACYSSLHVNSSHWWLCCWFLYSFSFSTCWGRKWVFSFRGWWTCEWDPTECLCGGGGGGVYVCACMCVCDRVCVCVHACGAGMLQRVLRCRLGHESHARSV